MENLHIQATKYTPEILSNISNVTEILETDFTEQWKMFDKKQPVNAVEEFGKGLKDLGFFNKINLLTKFGKDLLTHVENFDIDNIRIKIKEFPEVINKIKAIGG